MGRANLKNDKHFVWLAIFKETINSTLLIYHVLYLSSSNSCDALLAIKHIEFYCASKKLDGGSGANLMFFYVSKLLSGHFLKVGLFQNDLLMP